MRSVQNTLTRLVRGGSRRRISRGSLTRALAGTAIGARTMGRRGSVLVLVLGTLALMTVLAVVYVGIGKGDRQTARAIETREESRDVPEQVGEYLASVIGEDLFSTAPSYELFLNGQATSAHRREAWDAPFSDPIYRSNPLVNEPGNGDPFVDDVGRAVSDDIRRELLRFRPSGNHPYLFDDTDALGAGAVGALQSAVDFDRRVGSDPWLAAVEPINLDLHLPFNQRDDANLLDPPEHPTAPFTQESQYAYYWNRDILQMSNFAPDGRAVNLFNLRNNFDAPSDIGSVQGSISSQLTLFGGDDPEQPPYLAGDPQILWDSLTTATEADFNRPDHWFTNQRGAFRPMTDIDRGWGAPEFLFYQYADADGDGMVDSRWIELVDATDPDSPLSMLSHDGDFRYFVAVHAQDLSARVNVNTAKSGAMPPTREFPAGFTPGDIDLTRLLSLEDPWTDTHWAYSGLESPRQDNGAIDIETAENYTGYDPFNQDTGPRLLQRIGQAGFDSLQFSQLIGVVAPENVVIDLEQTVDALADYSIQEYGLDIFIPEQAGRESLIPSSPYDWRHSPFGRAQTYAVQATMSQGGSYADPLGEDRPRLISSGTFGLDALYDLLAFNGINNPEVLSDLEAAIGGRYDGDNSTYEGFFTRNLDPLRSNRGLVTERGDHDAFDTLYGGGIGGGGNVNGTPDGITDADALIRAATDVRSRITTISHGRPMRSSIVETPWDGSGDRTLLSFLTDEQANDLQLMAFEGNADGAYVPAGGELRSHVHEMTIIERTSWDHSREFFVDAMFVSLLDNPKAIFELYADALLPYSGVEGSWPTSGIGGGGSGIGTDPLHYGYRGPEFALRTSAHLAVNFVDAMDDDDVPTAATVLINEDARDDLHADEDRLPDARNEPWSFWPSAEDDQGRRVLGMKFDLNRDRNGDGDRGDDNVPGNPEARLANSGGRSGEAPETAAINVFGIEAQPFITEVSTMFAYHDTSHENVSSNPNLDPADNDVDDLGDPNNPPGTNEVEIDFSIRSRNADFLFWVIAVQLTNPFDEPVKIGRYVGDPDDPEDREALYYLDLNGEHFPLAGVPLDCYDYSRPECVGNPDGRNGGGPGGGGGVSNELWSNPGIVINPGESKVFVIPSQPLWSIEDRLEHRLGIYDSTTKDITQIGAILEAQFGDPDSMSGSDDSNVGETRENIVILDAIESGFDMTYAPFPEAQYAGAQVDDTLLDFDRLMAADLPGQAQGNEVPYELRLWRVMRPNAIEVDQDGEVTLTPIHEFDANGDPSNMIENDLLADRMHIDVFSRAGGGIGGGGNQPWFSVLDRRLNDPYTAGGQRINNAQTWLGEDDFGFISEDSYDGMAIVSHGTVSRPQDEAGSSGVLELRVPWYALEARLSWQDWNNTGDPWNEARLEGPDGDGWNGFPNVNSKNEVDDLLYDGFNNTRDNAMAFRRLYYDTNTGIPLTNQRRNGIETMVRMLSNDLGDPNINEPGFDNLEPVGDDAFRATTTGLPILEKEDSGKEDFENGGQNLVGTVSVELLAIELARHIDREAIRPADFLLPLGVGAVYDPDMANDGENAEWTTLSEMLARVLGFDEELQGGVIVDSLYAGVGHVRTQDSFSNNGATIEFGDPGAREVVVDPGNRLLGRAPLDKGHLVLDDFVPFLDGDPDVVIERFDETDGDIAFGMRLPPAITLLENVRTLFGDPAMGPNALDSTVPGVVNVNTASRTVLRTLPMLTPSRLAWWGEVVLDGRNSDIASTIQAYRDKTAVLYRDLSLSLGNVPRLVDFAEYNADDFDGANPSDDPRLDTPRQHGVMVSGLPEERGLRSVGELALMRSLGNPEGLGLTSQERNDIRGNNIDTLGFDGGSIGLGDGIESVRYAKHIGTVRNENSPGNSVIGDLGLHDVEDFYNDWTLTFLEADEPDLVGRSFLVEDYIGSDPGARTARRFQLRDLNTAPRPSKGDVFVVERVSHGEVTFFDPATPNVIDARGTFGAGLNFSGASIIFYGNTGISNATVNVQSYNDLGNGWVRLTLQTPLNVNFPDSTPVVGSAFVLRPNSYGSDLSGALTLEDDRINDEYDERLAILNSVLNTASVRSDVYAVWFLLHGYQESDVTGLGAEDPMLPTIRRRFVMVVDRSSVKKAGDKPEILLFKEVPL